MTRMILVCTAIGLLFFCSFFLRQRISDITPSVDAVAELNASSSRNNSQMPCQRIVSLAPSITEILYALGLGNRVVGVTRYCDYPEDALTKKKVGGYYDPSDEAIISLNPDMVVLLEEHNRTKLLLEASNTPVLRIANNTISAILLAIETIGDECDVNASATKVVADLARRIEAVKVQCAASRTARGNTKRVMISTGRNMGDDTISDAYIAGKDGFYSEILEIVGATNVYNGNMSYPLISAEGMLQLNPDVIIDMVPDLDESAVSRDEITAQWAAFGRLSAVQTGQVYVFTEGYVVVPGPRFVLLLEKVARLLCEQKKNGEEAE